MPQFSRRVIPATLTAVLACGALAACGQSDVSSTSQSSSAAPTTTPAAGPTTRTPTPTATDTATATSTPTERSAAPREERSPSTSRSTPSRERSTPTASATKRENAPAKKAPVAAGLPTDTGDYGDEVIAAWESGDDAALASHTTKSAAAALRGSKAGKGMLRTVCEDRMCSYSNDAGQRVTLRFDPAKVEAGAKYAVVSAKVAKN